MRGHKGGFSRYFPPTPMTDLAQIFTGLLFDIDIEVVIHEVWALDTTVYRKGPMALIKYLLTHRTQFTRIDT